MVALYFRLIGARVRAQMQYRVSFWLEMFGLGLTTALEFLVLVLLFARFPAVAGWSLPEVALLYGLSSSAFGFAEMIGRGFDSPFERMMVAGTFDAVLVRPLGSFFQILASEFHLRRLGRIAQAGAVMAYALLQADVHWSVAHVLLLPLTLVSGTLIFMAITLIGATICFWTIKTPEVINVFTSGGDFMASHPFSIYSRPIRSVFASVIPLAFVNYPAALVLLNKTDPHGFPPQLAWAAPLVASLFFALALRFWQFGVSKYTSAGS